VDRAAAGDCAVQVCEPADGFALVADAVMVGQVGRDRERRADEVVEVVEVDDRRVLSGPETTWSATLTRERGSAEST
jgi:hypothetical protein